MTGIDGHVLAILGRRASLADRGLEPDSFTPVYLILVPYSPVRPCTSLPALSS